MASVLLAGVGSVLGHELSDADPSFGAIGAILGAVFGYCHFKKQARPRPSLPLEEAGPPSRRSRQRTHTGAAAAHGYGAGGSRVARSRRQAAAAAKAKAEPPAKGGAAASVVKGGADLQPNLVSTKQVTGAARPRRRRRL